MFFGIIPAIFTTLLIPFTNPNPVTIKLLENPFSAYWLFSAFASMYLVSVGGTVIGSWIIIMTLIKLRDHFYHQNGIIAGNSLATNHEFLRTLAKGLWEHLLVFIRSFYDPRFEELEIKQQREIRELKEKSELDKLELKAEIKKISDKSERDKEEILRELRIKNLAIHKITNLKNEAERKVEEYKKKDSVKKQQIGYNIDAQDIHENTKIDNEYTKFKPRD
ncbi:MAG TPA: hypothetical protein VJ571_02470 [Candidatus Nitrosotalea sp.]|nr:hypothetical protein [Candidatus Nitrosotalea sp.]